MCIAVFYRPSYATATSFSDHVLQFLAKTLRQSMMIATSFASLATSICRIMIGKMIKHPQENLLTSSNVLSCFSKLFHEPYVICTTRKTITLDLFITNDDRLVTSAKALSWLMTSFVRSTGINYDQIHHLKSFLPCSQRLSPRCVNHASLPKPLQLASLDIQNLNALVRKKKLT